MNSTALKFPATFGTMSLYGLCLLIRTIGKIQVLYVLVEQSHEFENISILEA